MWTLYIYREREHLQTSFHLKFLWIWMPFARKDIGWISSSLVSSCVHPQEGENWWNGSLSLWRNQWPWAFHMLSNANVQIHCAWNKKKRPGGQVVTAAHFPGEFFEYKLLPPVLFSRRLATQHMEHQGVQTPKLCHSLLLALCCSQHGDNGWYTSPPS